MISLFVAYWKQLLEENEDAIVYVGKWGDTKRKGDIIPNYIKINGKTNVELVNLAIVRIKEEQYFIDNNLIKFVEVLHDFDLIDNGFYSQIKYGTNDERVICLIKNGVSLSSAMLLIKKYGDHLKVDVSASTVEYDENLISAMEKAKENQIRIHEILSCM